MTRVLMVVAFALLLAGCGGANSAVRDEGLAAGDRAVVSPATATEQTSTPATPAAPAPGVAFVYLLRFNQPEPTRRSVPVGMSVPESSMRELLSGPTLAEATLHYSTAIPESTRLLSYSRTGRLAIVDVSALPAVQGDNDSEALLALYQIVYTVTASGGIDAVQVRVGGRPYGLNSVTGGSSVLEPPLTRADLSFVVAAETLPGSTGCAVAKKDAPPYATSPGDVAEQWWADRDSALAGRVGDYEPHHRRGLSWQFCGDNSVSPHADWLGRRGGNRSRYQR